MRKPGAELGRYSDAGVLVLTSLVAEAKHGYAIIKDVQEFAGVTVSPGTLYGVLDRLVDQGLVSRLPSEDRRRPYEITAEGRSWLASYHESLARTSSTIALRLHGAK